MDGEFLTKAETAKLLKVSEVTIDRWRKDGLPCIKVNRKTLFEKDAVVKWAKLKSK